MRNCACGACLGPALREPGGKKRGAGRGGAGGGYAAVDQPRPWEFSYEPPAPISKCHFSALGLSFPICRLETRFGPPGPCLYSHSRASIAGVVRIRIVNTNTHAAPSSWDALFCLQCWPNSYSSLRAQLRFHILLEAFSNSSRANHPALCPLLSHSQFLTP